MFVKYFFTVFVLSFARLIFSQYSQIQVKDSIFFNDQNSRVFTRSNLVANGQLDAFQDFYGVEVVDSVKYNLDSLGVRVDSLNKEHLFKERKILNSQENIRPVQELVFQIVPIQIDKDTFVMIFFLDKAIFANWNKLCFLIKDGGNAFVLKNVIRISNQ